MSAPEKSIRPCWCGNRDLEPFSAEYRACRRCGTLASQLGLTAEQVRVRDDGRDYYGKTYWQEHMTEHLGLPPIEERAMADLPVRCIYWLRKLLTYRPPPARVLELASGHGGFVALLRAAGYDAVGLEVSPWVVEFARRTFGVPVLLGPVEEQRLETGSFDIVILNDLLEHVPDPAGFLGHCARLLGPEGLLVIQTPRYPSELSHEAMRRQGHPFLETMSPKIAAEHLYLFSESAVRRLLGQVGFEAVELEPPAHVYDMYLFAARARLRRHRKAEVGAALRATPSGRLVEGWLQAQEWIDGLRLELLDRKREILDRDRELSDKNGQLRQLWTELAQAAQTIFDNGRDLQRTAAQLERYQQRVGSLDDMGPTAVQVSRALTRLRRRFPALGGTLKRLLRRPGRAA
jgi:2-polyprenyl-3-methyl-5-hydroxy-6-metoxy-1,4-benzoquinol methylase